MRAMPLVAMHRFLSPGKIKRRNDEKVFGACERGKGFLYMGGIDHRAVRFGLFI